VACGHTGAGILNAGPTFSKKGEGGGGDMADRRIRVLIKIYLVDIHHDGIRISE
jgi:hypothetical protein